MAATYEPMMVIASVVVAIMASFTGLRLVSGMDALDGARRRVQIAKAAFALGGGIWSMHFVGMLAVRLPSALGYDALYTLGSVLIAILITGVGLSMMAVGDRSPFGAISAGTLTGLGIVSMHYVGMRAISANCQVSYQPAGFVISSAIAILFSICALRLSLKRRTSLQLTLGAIILGVTISAMHYSAMAFTRFIAVDGQSTVETPIIRSDYLALIVAVAAFVVCGLFLLTALPIERGGEPVLQPEAVPPPPFKAEAPAERLRLPYEHNNTTYFIDAERVHAIKADGHYTRLYDGKDVYFCPWSISKLETYLAGRSFLRTHRSFLVNIAHAGAFQRRKDKAFLIVPALAETMVPVSRFHVADVRRALGI